MISASQLIGRITWVHACMSIGADHYTRLRGWAATMLIERVQRIGVPKESCLAFLLQHAQRFSQTTTVEAVFLRLNQIQLSPLSLGRLARFVSGAA